MIDLSTTRGHIYVFKAIMLVARKIGKPVYIYAGIVLIVAPLSCEECIFSFKICSQESFIFSMHLKIEKNISLSLYGN